MHRTGQEVPASGIYRTKHRGHRLPHEVVLVAGQVFPRCGKCRDTVEFELVKTAPYLNTRNSIIVHEISARERDRGEEPMAA